MWDFEWNLIFDFFILFNIILFDEIFLKFNETALNIAIGNSNIEIIRILLDYQKTNINLKTVTNNFIFIQFAFIII